MESSIHMQATPHEVTLGKKTYPLLFDMAAFAAAEQVYCTEYQRTVNCGQIITEMLEGLTSALMALAYGALRSGGLQTTYRDFAQKVMVYGQYDALCDTVERALIQAMGVDQAQGSADGDEKN